MGRVVDIGEEARLGGIQPTADERGDLTKGNAFFGDRQVAPKLFDEGFYLTTFTLNTPSSVFPSS